MKRPQLSSVSPELILTTLSLAVCLVLGIAPAADAITVEDIYAKVLANIDKVHDMKITVFMKEMDDKELYARLPEEWRKDDPFYEGAYMEYWFLAPDWTLSLPDRSRKAGGILKGDKITFRNNTNGRLITEDADPESFTSAPEYLLFGKLLIDFLRKYEVVTIIDNPEPNIYVLKADPLPGFAFTPEDIGMHLEITVDYVRGVLLKMVFTAGLIRKVTRIFEWDKFEVFDDAFIAVHLTKTNYHYDITSPENKLRGRSLLDCKVTEIQVNKTGLKERDFKL